jgi:hypothetical protein
MDKKMNKEPDDKIDFSTPSKFFRSLNFFPFDSIHFFFFFLFRAGI